MGGKIAPVQAVCTDRHLSSPAGNVVELLVHS
jgi:hypothetical protein